MSKRQIKISESKLHRIIMESVSKILFEEDDMNGSDEEFNDFMSWAMTDGNDYGFGDAAGKYVNDGDGSDLYMIAMQYAEKNGMNPELVFNLAKEVAEGVYGFADDMGNNFIDLTNLEAN